MAPKHSLILCSSRALEIQVWQTHDSTSRTHEQNALPLAVVCLLHCWLLAWQDLQPTLTLFENVFLVRSVMTTEFMCIHFSFVLCPLKAQASECLRQVSITQGLSGGPGQEDAVILIRKHEQGETSQDGETHISSLPLINQELQDLSGKMHRFSNTLIHASSHLIRVGHFIINHR